MNKEKILLFAGIASLVVGASTLAYKTRIFSPSKNFMTYRHPVVGGNDIDKQILFLEDRLKKDPSSAMNHAILAQLYIAQSRRTGDVTWNDRAEILAKESMKKMSFGNVGARLVLAQIAESRHEFTKAIEYAKEIMKSKPFDDGTYRILVTSNLALGDTATAARYAEELVQNRPFLSTYTLRALVMVAQGRDEEAQFDFERALKVEDVGESMESTRTRALLGRFYMSRGKLTEAKQALDESLRIMPDYHFALAMMGQLEMKRKNYGKAEQLFMKAFEMSKQTPYLVLYAKAKSMGKDTTGAADALASAEKLIRADLVAHPYGHRLELAKLLMFRNGPKDNEEALKLAIDESKNRKSADAIAVLARALLENGRVENAKEAIQTVLAMGTKEAEYFETAAEVETKTGDVSRAIFYIDLAKRLDPSALSSRPMNASLHMMEKKKAGI